MGAALHCGVRVGRFSPEGRRSSASTIVTVSHWGDIMRTLIAALVSVWMLAAVAHAQLPDMPARDPQAQKTGTAQLSGRVISLESGRPLRRATVRAVGPELREGRSATTDRDGRWTLKGLPAGKYVVSVTKGGYVTLSYGQRRPFDRGQQVDVATGQTIDKLDVSLPKGGVIVGRIQDEFGEPFAGIRVATMRSRYVNGQRRLVAVGPTDTTDDIGQYRLHGLAPGEYYVSATNANVSFDVSDDRLGYATTYFPGTPMLGDAQRVTVTQGQETANVNFDLAPTRMASVSGIATNSQGKPLANSLIVLTSPLLQAGIPTLSPAMVRPDGSFTISNVTPGDYRLETYAVADVQALTAAGGQSGVAETVSMPITVNGEDITGLTVVAMPTTTATGRIAFEGESSPKVVPGAVTVMAVPPAPTSIIPGGLGRVRDDWTFEARGLTDRRIFRVSPPSGWYLKSVSLKGNDVTDSGVECTPGEDISGVEVLLTKQAGTIAGTAMLDSKRATDYVVVAFASDRARWGTPSRFVRTAKPDQSGRFEIKGLPADTYLVVALEYLEPGEEADPEVLERLRPHATDLTLAEGEAKVVSLKIR
jgi:carboxypeptidase family protein